MKLSTEQYQDAIKCPDCGFEWCHISGIIVEQGNHLPISIGLGNAIAWHPSPPEFPNRGSTLRVSMFCEAGHTFEITVRFHKGQTFIWAGKITELPQSEGQINWPAELWRN